MEGMLWILPVLGCGLMMAMMVVMMWMGKSMFSSDGEDREEHSVDDLRAEQARLAAQIDRLESRSRRDAT